MAKKEPYTAGRRYWCLRVRVAIALRLVSAGFARAWSSPASPMTCIYATRCVNKIVWLLSLLNLTSYVLYIDLQFLNIFYSS